MLNQLLVNIIQVGKLTVRCRGRMFGVFGKNPPGEPPLDVTIHLDDKRALWKLALNPDYQLGELYMLGLLRIEEGSLGDFLELCGRNQAAFERDHRNKGWRRLAKIWFPLVQRRNSRRKSRRNVAHHYDLSNMLYRLFLDEDMQYSCAYFREPGQSLEAAQRAKKDHIAAKLLLAEGQRILDIGSGWGGLGLSLAKQGAGHVTGVTLSAEQLSVANQRAKEAGLADRVEFHMLDYRDVESQFDRIVSVGMFEHVGAEQYETFFQTIARLLTEDGVALIHSIGHKDVPGPTNSWIRKYIFPGGHIPALSEVIPHIERAGLWITDIEILRLHYADTLHAWLDRFAAKRDEIKKIYDETFCRMWEFYLAVSEMSFRHGGLMVFQIQLAKSIEAVPRTRDYIESSEDALQRHHDGGYLDRRNVLEYPPAAQKTSA
jgi:cyclopropane-fatty-acyl-phospholipid synthase